MKKIIVDVGLAGQEALCRELEKERLDITGVCVSPDVKNYDDLCNMVAAGVKQVKDVPVYKGAQRPLLNREFANSRSCPAADYSGEFASLHRANFMIESAEKEDVEIICLGALSNVALAVMKNEEAMKKVKRIYVAGGALLGYRSTTPTSHENILADAEAARAVFKSGIPITMIPASAAQDIFAAAFDVAAGARRETWQAYLSVDTGLGFTRGQTVVDLVGRNPINGRTAEGEKQTVVISVK